MAQAAKQLKKIKDIEAQALQEQKEKEESNRKRRNRSRDRKKKTEARLFLMTSEAVDTLPTPGVLPHAPHGAAWVYGATLPPAPSVPTVTPSKKLSQVWARDTREEVPGLKGGHPSAASHIFVSSCCSSILILSAEYVGKGCTIIGNKLFFDVVFTPFPRNRTPSKQGASDQIGSVKTDPGDCLKTGSL
ncbi:hypothetical protein MJG53_019001 [Ovis ammon polii x Ovis aries]|uniref:Uncharacterized protein n=1 Tax=Ovis ammon polii x Ovis aries TaxID=2918886 RepID=A0ACB9U3J2_9CETA|nr:hypothetical protein MJG53_019001 [Ovis ammon polii x Ovis aries]